MLFWTKLLTAAHAATTSIHPFLCLYYVHRLGFDFLVVSILTAFVMILKVPASAFWIDLVDHRPSLHGVLTALLTAIGTAGILLTLSVPPTWTPFLLPIVIFSCVLDGLFYQPLEVLIDSAIIKILGDYRILYAHERQYGKIISALMAIGIGWFLDDDHDFDTLMVTILIGSVILFLLCLSTSVQPTDPTLLGITPPDIDEQSPLVKPTDLVDTSSLPYYKPYSLFREHLSHISEEDASLLQHMTTTNNSIATKLLRRPMSVCSEFSCMSYATIPNNMMRSQSAIIQPYPIHHESEHDQPKSLQAIQSSMHQLLNDQIPPSFELARLPYPPPQAPAIVLITFIPGYNKRQGPLPQQENPSRCHIPSHHHYQSKWILRSFASSIFCLGIVFGMTQPLLYLHLHDTLGFPMHTIGLIGFLTILADYLARHLVLKVIQYCHLPTIIVGAHITLTLCTFSYTQLQPGGCLSTQVWASVLQSLFALAIHSVWLMAAHQVDSVVLIGHERMMLKGTMAALYSSLGPALGLLLTGYLVGFQPEQYDDTMHGYHFVYQYAALFSIISGILSWEWSASN